MAQEPQNGRMLKHLRKAVELADSVVEMRDKVGRTNCKEEDLMKVGKGSKVEQMEAKKERKAIEHIVAITRDKKKKDGYISSVYPNPCA
jgi:hypothetical protein